MRFNRRILANIIYIILGVILFGLGLAGILDPFWSGMGGALISVGIVRTIHMLRYAKDTAYREEKTIEATDERHQFLRNKAWAWAGYLFVLLAAVSAIVFKLLDQEALSIAAGAAVAILMLLYWGCFWALRKKY